MVVWNETVPAGFPPEEYHESRVSAVIGVAVTSMVLSVVSVILRFTARWMSGVQLWWDDWFALANVPSAFIQPIVMFLMMDNGLGRNPMVVVNTDPTLLAGVFPKAMAACTGIILSLTAFKLSQLALYYRIFRTARRLRQATLILGGVIVVWFVIGEVLNFFRCMDGIGVPGSVAGACVITDPQWNYYVAVPTVVFDVLVVTLPIREVWNLKLQRYQRIGVIGVFALGSTVTAVSCYKVYLLAVEITQQMPWSVYHLAILAAIEICVGTIGCSLTTYTPFIHAIRLKLGLTTKASNSYGSYPKGSGGGGHGSRIRDKFSGQNSGRFQLHDGSQHELWEMDGANDTASDKAKQDYKFSEQELAESPIRHTTESTRDQHELFNRPGTGHRGVLRTTEIRVQNSAGQAQPPMENLAIPGLARTTNTPMGVQPFPSGNSSEVEFARRGA